MNVKKLRSKLRKNGKARGYVWDNDGLQEPAFSVSLFDRFLFDFFTLSPIFSDFFYEMYLKISIITSSFLKTHFL
jgi:hypothetical protein